MTVYDFDKAVDRRGTASEKWDKYAGREVLPLWVADMDFPSPPEVMAALQERVAHGIFGYTHPPQELVETLLEVLWREHAWRVDPSWLVWLPGLVCGLNVTCRAIGAAGDEVATFTPVYPPFMSAPVLSGRRLIKVPLVLDRGGWMLDLPALEQAITPRTKLLLLCSPHNPVGRVWTREELLALAELAERYDLTICSDEIHAGLVLDPQKVHLPLAGLAPEIGRRTITLNAPSKTFNIPGLGCSYAIISDPELRRTFKRAMAGIVPHVNTLGLVAALAAYRHGEQWRQALIHYLRGNHALVQEGVARMPGLAMTPVEATYLAWIDARQCGTDRPAQFFEDAGVGLSDGADFGLAGFVRLNFGCPRSTLTQALQRMESAWRAAGNRL